MTTPEKRPGPPTKPTSNETIPDSPIKIAFFNSDPDITEGATDCLRQQGYQVDAFSNPESFQRHCNQDPDSIHRYNLHVVAFDSADTIIDTSRTLFELNSTAKVLVFSNQPGYIDQALGEGVAYAVTPSAGSRNLVDEIAAYLDTD